MTIRVLCYGLGPIGLGIARLAASRSNLEIIGAYDTDPVKGGRDLGELLGSQLMNLPVLSDPEDLEKMRPDVVLHATGSALEKVAPQFRQIMALGAHIVSTCEELAFPWTAQPHLAATLDAEARKAGVTLLGTGINPGYAMDALPLMLTAPCASVTAIRVLRVVDAGRRRGPLQRKVGVGLSVEEFNGRVQDGTVRHVGLPESLHMLATAMGWHLSRTESLIQPVVTNVAVADPAVAIGHVLGVRQVVNGFLADREVLRLELQMYLGAPDERDSVEIDGEPPVRMTIAGGLHGDTATAAMIVNAVGSVVRAQPGLATMADLPLVHYR